MALFYYSAMPGATTIAPCVPQKPCYAASQRLAAPIFYAVFAMNEGTGIINKANRHALYYLLDPAFRNINLIPAFNATETLRNVLAFIATGMYLRDHSFRQRNGVVYRRFD